MRALDRARLQSLMQREQKKFVDERPKSRALFERARKSLLAGVPMNWMVKWAGAFPPFVREAQGAHFFDVDGHRYTDFCLGDTGAMTGHSPFATVKAAEEQMRRGITLMLPGEDAILVAEELQKRFHLPFWQFALTATDASPTLGDGKANEVDDASATTGTFSESVTGLSPLSSYSFVAFATTSAGTSYTTPVSTFTTLAVVPWRRSEPQPVS